MEQNLIQIAHKHSAYANEIDILYNPTLTKEDATRIKNQYLTIILQFQLNSILPLIEKLSRSGKNNQAKILKIKGTN